MISHKGKIKFIIVGSGFIGKKHEFFINQHQDAELVATIDPKEENSDYKTIEEFLNEKIDVDVACIATPNGLHAKQAKQLLKAGIHTVVEKPLAISLHEAKALKLASEQFNRKVFVVMQNRYSPAAIWLKDLCDKELLGDIFMVQINCFWNRDERYYSKGKWHGNKSMDGGTLYTQFSHFIDLLYWCFGDFNSFESKFYDFNHKSLTEIEDSGIVNFKFERGGVGQFNYSTSCFSRNLESSITIIAQNGTVKIGGQYMDEITHCDIKDFDFEPVLPYTQVFGKFTGNAANHRFVIDNVVNTLKGHDSEHTNLDEGVAVVRIIEEIYNQRK